MGRHIVPTPPQDPYHSCGSRVKASFLQTQYIRLGASKVMLETTLFHASWRWSKLTKRFTLGSVRFLPAIIEFLE